MGQEVTVSSIALSWSGGKDSALALFAGRELGLPVTCLITTVTASYGRISMHGVRESLLDAQARSLGLPLVKVYIPAKCSNEVYEKKMGEAVGRLLREGTDAFAFGDIFLEDVRAYREDRLKHTGARVLFPLWGKATDALAASFIRLGFRATLVTVDPRQMDASFAGRVFDEALLEELPSSVDPCGERGEFHTFVHEGPIFTSPINIAHGEVVERDGFVFQDLIQAGF